MWHIEESGVGFKTAWFLPTTQSLRLRLYEQKWEESAVVVRSTKVLFITKSNL